MFEDEAGFGRINQPKHCWCAEGIRPSVPCHHIREYEYAYGAVDPISGDSFFLIMPCCNTNCMNVFIDLLSKAYPDDIIVMVCDRATWHKSKTLELPENIHMLHIPPYTPEMNPIEQIWRELRTCGFRNESFHSLQDLENRLVVTINNLTNETVRSITGRQWVLDIFNTN